MHRPSLVRPLLVRPVAVLTIVVGLLLSACAAADEPTAEPAPGSGTPGATTSEGTAPAEELDGPAAPDFTLALGADRSESFTLSEGAMPVYMVFWAEW